MRALPPTIPPAPLPLSFRPLICNALYQWTKLHICVSDHTAIGVLFWRRSRRGMMLTTHFYLLQRLRMNGAIPLLPHMPPWRVQGKCYLYFSLYISDGTLSCHRCNFVKTIVTMGTVSDISKFHKPAPIAYVHKHARTQTHKLYGYKKRIV
jgi:hypothetical protein